MQINKQIKINNTLETTTDYIGSFVYEDNELKYILTPEGRALPDGNGGFEYQYYLKDHLGNVRIMFDENKQVLQNYSYYPFGMEMPARQKQSEGGNGFDYNASTTLKNDYLYNGKELQDEFGLGWYDYVFRFYDPQLGRWHVPDPLAEEYYKWSPFNYALNNPIKFIDPNGSFVDGYQNLQGEYKWHDNETEQLVYKDDQFWLKVTDDKNTFDMLEAGVLDNIPEPNDPGEITESDNLSNFEMWLDSPSESVGEGIGKIGANIGYSLINSPYSLITGETIGGTSLNSSEKMDAFVDFVPGLISGGLTKTGQVVKTTKKGLQGFNQFVKRTPGITTTEGLPAGMKWQQRAGQLFQTNKVNQQGLKDLDKARNVLNVVNTTKKELEK